MPTNPTAMALDAWIHLLRFQRSALSRLDAELRAAHGIGLDAYDVLQQLTLAVEPLRMGDLTAALLIAPSSCTRIVGSLERSGLVERAADPTDRRAVRVSITEEGRVLRRRAAVTHVRGVRALLRDVEPEVLAALGQLPAPTR